MALELIKISEFPESSDPKDWIVVSDSAGNAYKLSKANLKTFLGTVTVTAPKAIKTTDPAPTIDGIYIPTNTGTYANAGGLTYLVTDGYVQFIKNGSTWVKSNTPMPQAENKILPWVAGTYTIGTQRNHNGQIWECTEPSTMQEPSKDSEDWEGVIIVDGNAIKKLSVTPEKTTFIIEEIGKNKFNVNSSENQLGFNINPANGVSFSQTGAYLTYYIPAKSDTWYVYTAGRYAIAWYDENKVFISGVSAGGTAENKSPIGAAFQRVSTINNFDMNTFQVEEGKTRTPFEPYEITTALDPSIAVNIVANGVIEEGNNNPVNGDKVFTELIPVKNQLTGIGSIINNVFNPENSDKIGGDSILNQTSTFAAWGQGVGIKKDFNAIEFPVLPYSSGNVPTYVELRIRDSDQNGEVLSFVRVEGSFQHNKISKTLFLLPEIFTNPENKSLFMQFNSNGYIASIGSPSGSLIGSLKYNTSKGASTTPSSTTNTATLGMSLLLGSVEYGFTGLGEDKIKEIVGENTEIPALILPSKVWLYPGLQYNIFNKNVLLPVLHDKLDNHELNYTSGTIGRQFKRGYRLDPVAPSLNTNITLTVDEGASYVLSKSQNLLSGSVVNGNGQDRAILFIADSIIANEFVINDIKSIFELDVMNVNFKGTLGTPGSKHEARPGWGVNSFYGQGSVSYQVNVTGLADSPSVGSVYSQSVNYTVREVNITGGTGYFSVEQSSGSARPLSPSGTLTKVSGVGASSIDYLLSSSISSNPFYNPDPLVLGFDLEYYLLNSSQTLISGDWIHILLGINDMFSAEDSLTAKNRASDIWGKMLYILDNIRSYNPDIRVGISLLFPASDQDGFGANYALGKTSEVYNKVSLIEWQKKLILELDNETQRGMNRFLISTHSNLDSEYNFPSVDSLPNSRYSGNKTVNMQNNALHPNKDGCSQIADMYAGIIKYFG